MSRLGSQRRRQSTVSAMGLAVATVLVAGAAPVAALTAQQRASTWIVVIPYEVRLRSRRRN